MKWVGYVACMEEMKKSYKILIGKSEGKKPLKKTWAKMWDNIKMDLEEMRLKDVDWIYLARIGASGWLL
jgi:hypothetical protein